jgi:hypothetical protein
LQKTSAQWQKDNGQYIPNPATWLNQGRWDDEIKEPEDTRPPGKQHYNPFPGMYFAEKEKENEQK